MPEYILRRGTHRRRDGTRAEPGDRVTLTDRQTEQFNMDRFEPVADADAESAAAAAAESDVESSGHPPADDDEADAQGDEAEAADVDLPDDYRTLQQMAVAYEGDEVNGATSGDELRAFFATLDADAVADLRAAADEAA